MSVLLLHWRGWWMRFFGRPGPARAPMPARPTELHRPADPVPAAEIVAPRESAVVPAARAPADAASLLETLQLSSLAQVVPSPRAVDPAARERMLAGLRNLRQIPALQSLAAGFLRAMGRPEVAVDEVVAAIEKDSALCVRVLRMANSVLISPERRIEDLETAVQMLGVVRVRQAAQALFTLRDANRVAEGFD